MATLHAGGPPDVPGVYRVCRLTADGGGDATRLHADPDLVGHVWAGPYLAFPDAVAVVVRDEAGVAGYCLGVPDTTEFERWLQTEWLPPLRERHPAGSGATAADRALVHRIHAWPPTNPALLPSYPAHLHIDLLPRLQGQGWGRRSLEALLDGLVARGAPGVHLGVSPANTRAVAFYERLGFTEVADDDSTRWLARTLDAAWG